MDTTQMVAVVALERHTALVDKERYGVTEKSGMVRFQPVPGEIPWTPRLAYKR